MNNKIPCLYAVVHFAPFVETGEFANVGIIMMAPEQRYFGFKLMGRRHSRVTHFFEQLEAKVFRATMNTLREELDRAGGMLRHKDRGSCCSYHLPELIILTPQKQLLRGVTIKIGRYGLLSINKPPLRWDSITDNVPICQYF